MGGIGEIDRIVFTFVYFELLMFFEITFKLAHLMLVEFWLCSGIVIIQQ